MALIDDMMVFVEGTDEEVTYYSALQRAINNGEIWCMEGAMGRAAIRALEEGRCVLGRESCRDYYGNRIPSRTEVKAGTKGSVQLARDNFGDEWADMIEAL